MQNLELDLSLTKFTPFQCFINLKKNLKKLMERSREVSDRTVYVLKLDRAKWWHYLPIGSILLVKENEISSWSNNWIKKYKPNFTSKHWNIYCIYTPKRCYTEFLPNVILSDGFRHIFCKGPSEIFFPDKVGMLMERFP